MANLEKAVTAFLEAERRGETVTMAPPPQIESELVVRTAGDQVKRRTSGGMLTCYNFYIAEPTCFCPVFVALYDESARGGVDQP